jgi:hypothetical protein
MSTTDPHSPITRRRAALPVRFATQRIEELKFVDLVATPTRRRSARS